VYMKIFQHKLTSDISWSIGSFIVLAVSGMLIKLLIVCFRDTTTLGAFNLAYTTYMISAQIAVFGVHYSVIRHIAHHDENDIHHDKILFNAAFLALCLGITGAGILYGMAPWLGKCFDSRSAQQLITHAAIGLILFPLNKVLLAYLNGLRLMKLFALLQSSRYIIVMLFVITVATTQGSFQYATLGFITAECITTLVVLMILYQKRLIPIPCFDNTWIRQHITFGAKSLLAGMFVEMNSRIDVLMIGFFLNDQAVGIYSFASMLVDGLYHILAMVRLNFNPLLVAATRDKLLGPAQNLLTQCKRFAIPVTALLCFTALTAFWILANVMMPAKGFQPGLLPLMILLIGLTTISAFIPFDNLLLVSGHPSAQTLQHCITLLSNIGLGWLLIPQFGMLGAACATAASYLFGIVALQVLVKHLLGWDLFNNRLEV
jgi:O-antigen/teichoic acid export membrane protein